MLVCTDDHPCGGAYETQSERLGYANKSKSFVTSDRMQVEPKIASARSLDQRKTIALEEIAKSLKHIAMKL